jgi:tRNA pseudouridine55 synthase
VPGAPAQRIARRRVDGILLLDKPAGLSSNAALQRAKRAYRAEKAGHAGTLDPLATGLLPVCFGEATKFVQPLLDAPKRYAATIRFGTATTTGDAEGDVIARAAVAFDRDALERALAAFTGTIAQRAPLYSALKRHGRPYYAYARAGQDVERAMRDVAIMRLDLVDWTPPDAVVDVACSKGTYVRVLAEEIGVALGSCAHLAALRRTATAGFRIGEAIALERVEAMDDASRDARLLPCDAALATVPALRLDELALGALRRGQRPAHDASPGRYRAYGTEGFAGIVEATGTELRVVRLMAAAA